MTSCNLGCMVKSFEGQRNEHEAHDKMTNEKESFWLLWISVFCYESPFRKLGKTRGDEQCIFIKICLLVKKKGLT